MWDIYLRIVFGVGGFSGVRETWVLPVLLVFLVEKDALLVRSHHSRRLVPVPFAPDEFLGRALRAADARPGPGNLDGVID